MFRARMWIVVLSLVAAVAALAPPAVADTAEDLGPPFSRTGNELDCGTHAGYVGSPAAPAPRPPVAPTAVPLKCTASHKVERPGLLSGAISVSGSGSATEGTHSSLMAYGYSRHRLTKSVDRVRYEVTFSVEDALAEVPTQHRLTTTSFVMLYVYTSHTACRTCKGESFAIIVDTDARSTTPERVQKVTHTAQVDLFDSSGRKTPSGTVGIVIAVFPMVMTGTYATPVDVLGSASVRARITRITATTA